MDFFIKYSYYNTIHIYNDKCEEHRTEIPLLSLPESIVDSGNGAAGEAGTEEKAPREKTSLKTSVRLAVILSRMTRSTLISFERRRTVVGRSFSTCGARMALYPTSGTE